MQTLPTKFAPFLDLLVANRADKITYARGYYMAIDAEWHAQGDRNTVLSYQIATVTRNAANNIIEFMPGGLRLPLAEIVERGIRSVHGGQLPPFQVGHTYNVILVSHHLVAEWSVLADRNAPSIVGKLKVVRKSPVTGIDPIRIHLSDYTPVDVCFYDTRLIAPVAFQSLQKLSSLLGSDDELKEDIPQHYKARMDLFLQEDRDGFIRYALKDSEITLKLFLKLQESLNELVYGDNVEASRRLFLTLGSATVKAFLERNSFFPDYLKSLNDKRSWKSKNVFTCPQKAESNRKRCCKKKRTPECQGVSTRVYLGDPDFRQAYRLVERAYHGGRNEGYFVGDSRDYEVTRDRIWIDIDFSGCYPTAMSLCPLINTKSPVDLISLQYRIDDSVVAALETDGIPPALIDGARAALGQSSQSFELYLKGLKSKKQASALRQHALVIDNRLVNNWRERCATGIQTGSTLEQNLIPGFARIRFKFPKETVYPCLPIRDQNFGLIYPLEGETDATAAEIVLAMEAGAQIEALTSVELPVLYDKDGQPARFFHAFIEDVLRRREEFERDKHDVSHQIYAKLLKEFANSAYGKFAQGVNTRRYIDPTTNRRVALGPSEVSEPSVAALTTGLARAALSATLLAVERYNRAEVRRDAPLQQIVVVSATTDGLLIGLPVGDRVPYSVAGDYYHPIPSKNPEATPHPWPKGCDATAAPLGYALGKGEKYSLPAVLRAFSCDELLPLLDGYLPLRQMRRARQELTGDATYLEIKHMADWVIGVKTRGQLGFLSTGHCTIIARFGLRPALSEAISDTEDYKTVMNSGGITKDTWDAKWIVAKLDEIANGQGQQIPYTFFGLKNFKEILNSDGSKDMTQAIAQRVINSDFDWKRRLDRTSPLSSPFGTLAEMKRYRGAMESIRKHKRVALPSEVITRVQQKGRVTRSTGGTATALIRLFLRGLVQEKIEASRIPDNYQGIVDRLNEVCHATGATPKVWSHDALKNARRSEWDPHSLLPTEELRILSAALASAFGADPPAVQELLFVQEDLGPIAGLLDDLIKALIHAPRLGIEPFASLYHAGHLPPHSRLIGAFAPLVSEESLQQARTADFIIGSRPSHDFKPLVRLFSRIGITGSDATACARVIAPSLSPPGPRSEPKPRSRCLELFVRALFQTDITIVRPGHGLLLERLERYGLTRPLLKLWRNGKFQRAALANSAQNRAQIRKMAKALHLNPDLYLAAILDQGSR